MKSLTKNARTKLKFQAQEQPQQTTLVTRSEQAQCCAKISKSVAGCHD